MISVETLERYMLIAKDTRKEFNYNLTLGRWGWKDRDDEEEFDWRFDTFFDALRDAVDPYIGEESGKEIYNLNAKGSGFQGRGRLLGVFKDEEGELVFQFEILEDTNNCKDLHGDDERGYWFLPWEVEWPTN